MQNFLTTPVTRLSSPLTIFWFSLSITFSAIYGILGLQEAFRSEYIVSGDGRQHLFWMRRFLDSELFPYDLIADYFQSVAPPGYATLYKLMAGIGIDPLFFSKLLPMALVVVTTAYCFGISMEILPVPAAGFFATLILNQNIWIDGSLPSGTARSFIYPLFLAFLYYLLRRSLFPCLIAIALQGLFYPPWLFIIGGVLALQPVYWECWRLSLSRDRKDYLFNGAGLAVVCLVLLPFALQSSEFGPTITAVQARILPEFSETGRANFFLKDPIEFWFCGERSGFLPWKWCDLPLQSPQLWLGLSLPLLLSYSSPFPLSQQVSEKVKLLWQTLLASLVMFIAAHAVLFKLYLPGRYPQHSLQIVMPIAAGIALILTLNAIFNWAEQQGKITLISCGLFLTALALLVNFYLPIQYRKKGLAVLIVLVIAIAMTKILDRVWNRKTQRTIIHLPLRHFLALTLTAVLSSVLVFYPTFLQLQYVDFPYTGYKRGEFPELYEFFAKQPKDILIASLAEEANNLPTFAQRSVLVGWKFAVPYSIGYYTHIHQRAVDLIDAQYSPDLEEVKRFIQKYGVDFWLLDREAFAPEYLAKPRTAPTWSWIRQHQPAARKALEKIEQQIVPALATVTKRCSVLETEIFIVIQTKCINQNQDRPK